MGVCCRLLDHASPRILRSLTPRHRGERGVSCVGAVVQLVFHLYRRELSDSSWHTSNIFWKEGLFYCVRIQEKRG